MPTPFTHLAYAQRLLTDDELPENARQLLQSQRPAFLLGSIAADAQTVHQLNREITHFYNYDQPLEVPPYQIMLRQFPELALPVTLSQRAFIAGYVFHLSIDEIWSVEMIHPYFVMQEWGTKLERFLALQLLLITMDERDRESLLTVTIGELTEAQPSRWLPFIADDLLVKWRDLITLQLLPGGHSQTLEIVCERAPTTLQLTPGRLRDMLDSPVTMEQKLESHVPQSAVLSIETQMYQQSRERLIAMLG
ncbi:MAG: zinc dependent phospholipase C family protein [Anaerolineae bacterium]|nr:zinc dependent phospholipase C family protein [Anaerolineae bacterium]